MRGEFSDDENGPEAPLLNLDVDSETSIERAASSRRDVRLRPSPVCLIAFFVTPRRESALPSPQRWQSHVCFLDARSLDAGLANDVEIAICRDDLSPSTET